MSSPPSENAPHLRPTNGVGLAARATPGLAPSVYSAIRCLDAPQVHRGVGEVSPDAPLFEAVNRMWWRQRGTVVVVDEGRLVGALSEDDLLRIVLRSLHDRADAVDAHGENLLLWEELLGERSVRDVMSPLRDLAVVTENATLLDGLGHTFEAKESGARRRYIFVVDANGALLRVVSMRDVCRYLISLYDGNGAFRSGPASTPALRRSVASVLDLPVGLIRSHRDFGHAPIVVSIEDSGSELLETMWKGQRGYAVVAFFDGAPQGICTRRDLLRALRRPHCRLRDLSVANLMSAEVRAASHLITLGGVFKLMAIGGYRHMPLVDAKGQLECVLSMWEGVTLLITG